MTTGDEVSWESRSDRGGANPYSWAFLATYLAVWVAGIAAGIWLFRYNGQAFDGKWAVALLVVPAAFLLWPLAFITASRRVRLSASGLVVRTQGRRRPLFAGRNKDSEQAIPWDRLRSWRLEKRLRDGKVSYQLALRLRKPVQGMIVSPPDEASADAAVAVLRRYVPTASGRLDTLILPGERQWRALAVVAIAWSVLLIVGYATGALTANPFQWQWLPLGLLAGPGLPWFVLVVGRGARPAWLWMGSALVVNLYANMGTFMIGRFGALIVYLQEYRP